MYSEEFHECMGVHDRCSVLCEYVVARIASNNKDAILHRVICQFIFFEKKKLSNVRFLFTFSPGIPDTVIVRRKIH